VTEPEILEKGTATDRCDFSIESDREMKKDFRCDSLMLRPVQSKIQWF